VSTSYSSTSTNYGIGGVAGYVYGSSSTYCYVDNCYNTGTVSASSTTSFCVGGVVGRNYYGYIRNCYTGNTITINSSNTTYSGNVCGYNYTGGYVQYCHFRSGMISYGTTTRVCGTATNTPTYSYQFTHSSESNATCTLATAINSSTVLLSALNYWRTSVSGNAGAYVEWAADVSAWPNKGMPVLKKCEEANLSYSTPNPSITYGSQSTYTNNSLTYASGVTGIEYSIVSQSPSGTASINTSTGQLTISKVGTVIVKATLSGNNTYCDDEATYTLTVNCPTISTPTATATVVGCNGSATLTATPPSGCTIDWYTASSGGSIVSGGTGTNSLTVNSSGNYFAQARSTNTNTSGCTSSSRKQVTATVYPSTIPYTGLAASYTDNATVNITLGGGFSSYAWTSNYGDYGNTSAVSARAHSGLVFHATASNSGNACTASVDIPVTVPETSGGSASTCGTKIIYVSTTGSDSNNGSSTAPVLTISKALTLATGGTASNPAIIRVASGTYNINAPLKLISNVIIDGQWTANTTTGVWTKGTTATEIKRKAENVEGSATAPRIVAIEGSSKSNFKLQDVKVTTDNVTTSTLSVLSAGSESIDPSSYSASWGSGSSTLSYPIPGVWEHHLSHFVYTSSELGGAMTIKAIGFNVSSATDVPSGGATRDITIYLKNSSATSLSTSSTWSTTISGATQVYNGTINITTGWNVIPITQFNYTGGSLQVMILGTGCTTSGGCGVYVYSSSATSQFVYNVTDADSYTASTTTLGSTQSYKPNIRLYTESESEGAIVTASNYGISTYAVHLNNCSSYEIIRCRLEPGAASAGRQGETGEAGSNGNGTAVGASVRGSGSGGSGGAGGAAYVYYSGSGSSGSSGTQGGLSGGAGGNGGGGGSNANCNGDGGNGSAGSKGTNGGTGANATQTATALTSANYSNYFIPGAQGVSGSPGKGGGGGGGGGAGGSRYPSFMGDCYDRAGGRGGKGGGGGAGGAGGYGGYGGGSAFGLYLYNDQSGKTPSQIITNGNNYVSVNSSYSGAGGAGGSGGPGGNGGTGANGSSGSAACGQGGKGGSGGNGGSGGKGQPGAAGVAKCYVSVGANGTLTTSGAGTQGTAPNSAIASIDYGSSSKQGCTNSQISLSKSSGSWASGQYGELINDKNGSTSSYTTGSSSIITGYGSTGTYTPVSGGSRVFISQERMLGTISGPTTICGSSENYTYNGTLTSGDVLLWYLLSTDGNTQYDSRVIAYSGSQTPYTINPESLGLAAGTYNIKLMVKSNCCGVSIPIWLTVTVGEEPSAPTNPSSNAYCGTSSATFTASAPSGCTIDWYTASTGGSLVAEGTTSHTASISGTTTYYAQSRNTTTGCVSATRTAVTCTINTPPAKPTNPSSNAYCEIGRASCRERV
jgi:hypothetical protein